MNNELSFKELYDVSLKATYPIEVGGNSIESGEIIASFDKIQLANFQEIKSTISANGGYGNTSLITWESTKEVKINFTQGVFSKIQLALMTNANLVENKEQEKILIDKKQEFESDENGDIILPLDCQEKIFIYDTATGKKITSWTRKDNILNLNQPYKTVVIAYQYPYTNKHITLTIGRALTQGYLSLTGKMRIKDDITGKVKTGIINIPKLRLMSDLSMRVGSDAIPQVGRLDAVAVPEGARGQQKVMEIIFLDDDIDADM